jgi:probable HAF family extracellular repeat protein
LAVNAAGDVVVGEAADGSANGAARAFRWTQAGGMQSLGTLNGGLESTASRVSATGDVVVGGAEDGNAGDAVIAFRWTQATGMQSLGVLNGGATSFAADVNAAGDVIVGFSHDGIAQRAYAFRWTQTTGMQSLGVLNGGVISDARGVNAAGDVVVGAADDGNANGATRAFRWTTATGMVSLGALNGGSQSVATAVDDVGDVVVGTASDDNAGVNRAFRWTPATGMQSIEDWLGAHGVAVDPTAPKTRHASDVNATGDVVVGILDNEHAFLARVTPQGAGLIDMAMFNQSLNSVAAIPGLGLQGVDLVMHGAHGYPMRALLPSGVQSFWVAGDWGRSDDPQAGTDVGAGEVGYGRGLTDHLIVRIALGGSYSEQELDFGGDTQMYGAYVLPELTLGIPNTAVWATISAYYNAGRAEIKRGYTNAGTDVRSSGEPDVESSAIRARFDWLDAVTFGDTAFTPYASITYLRTKVDGYTETGGGFPASWNSRTETSTQARVGLDAVHRLASTTYLLGRIEGVHRFEDEGADASGQVIGLFSFDLQGASYKQDWLRLALGLEHTFGRSTATITLNATTEAETPSYWIAASYRWWF